MVLFTWAVEAHTHMTAQMTVIPYESGKQEDVSGTQMILNVIENLQWALLTFVFQSAVEWLVT